MLWDCVCSYRFSDYDPYCFEQCLFISFLYKFNICVWFLSFDCELSNPDFVKEIYRWLLYQECWEFVLLPSIVRLFSNILKLHLNYQKSFKCPNLCGIIYERRGFVYCDCASIQSNVTLVQMKVSIFCCALLHMAIYVIYCMVDGGRFVGYLDRCFLLWFELNCSFITGFDSTLMSIFFNSN